MMVLAPRWCGWSPKNSKNARNKVLAGSPKPCSKCVRKTTRSCPSGRGLCSPCKDYLGVEPTIDLWARFFSLKQQGPLAGEFADCGAAVISKRSGADFPKIPLEDSAKKWQNSFFYVCNLGADRINLLAFAIVPPWAKTN